jgi:predicted transcriptional regulator
MEVIMTRPPHDVPEAELAVLEVLWALGPATRRQITDRLYPGGGASAYTTVQKLLERLEHRELVSREGSERLLFTARISKEELISRQLADLADRLCGGSLAPLLLNLVKTRPLSAGEVEQLRALVRQLSKRRDDSEPRS